jgi:hypothetical protein
MEHSSSRMEQGSGRRMRRRNQLAQACEATEESVATMGHTCDRLIWSSEALETSARAWSCRAPRRRTAAAPWSRHATDGAEQRSVIAARPRLEMGERFDDPESGLVDPEVRSHGPGDCRHEVDVRRQGRGDERPQKRIPSETWSQRRVAGPGSGLAVPHAPPGRRLHARLGRAALGAQL